VRLLVSEQYIDSIMHGAIIKVKEVCWAASALTRLYILLSQHRARRLYRIESVPSQGHAVVAALLRTEIKETFYTLRTQVAILAITGEPK